MKNLLVALASNEQGASTVDYALLIATFSVATIAVVSGLGVGISDVMAAVTDALDPGSAAETPAD